jgi:DNA-binding CsgD family transcriptional regulator
MASLGAKLADAFEARGSVVMLAGEAGIGKTAIVREFASLARERGVLVLSGSCWEGGWQPAYGPWVEALGGLIAGLDSARLSVLMSDSAPALAHLFPALRSALPGTPEAAPLTPTEARFRLYDAVSRFLARLADEAPVLLALDDLHWADRETLALLRYVARGSTQSRLLILGAYREPDPDDGTRRLATELLAVVRREAKFARIGVGGLSARQVQRYLEATTGMPAPPRLARVLHDETAGNPFYLGELVRQLMEEGRLADAAWAGDPVAGLGVPAGVREILARRMSRLSAEARQVLGIAWAFSGGFELPLLAALTGLSEPALLDAIDELLGAGLIRPLGERRPGYDFAHALVRHALADEVNPDRRARLHRRIAHELEGADPAVRAAELAYQYHASRALPNAELGIPHCRAAADEAAASHAPERAARFLRMAADLAAGATPAERADILCSLAVAEAEALVLDDARASVDDALAALTARGADAEATAAFLARVTRTLKEGGASRPAWEPLVERGLELLGDRRDLTWARLTLLRDRLEVVSTGVVNASRLLDDEPQAVALVRAEGDEDDHALTFEPLRCRTREETDHVLALARRWRRPTAVMRALDVAARDLLHRHGAFDDALETLGELLDASERYGSIPGQAEALVQLSAAHAALGELALAREEEQRARELVGRLGPQHRLHLILDLVVATQLAYLTEGDWDALARHATRNAASREAARGPLGPAWAALAVVNLSRTGADHECRRLLDALTPVLDRLGPRVFRQSACVFRAGEAVWRFSASDYAPDYQRLALDLVTAGVADAPLASNALTVARMAALIGDDGGAAAWFARARSELEADGRRPLRAVVDYDEGLALVRARSTDQARIEALLNAAVAAFGALGMTSWELDARELLAARTAPLPDRLTVREAEVLGLLAAGKTNKEIAAELVLSPATVERHVANIYRKIGARRRAEATAYALTHGLVDALPRSTGFPAGALARANAWFPR